MKFIPYLFCLLLLFSCASHREEGHPSGLEITEVQPNKETYIMKQNMLHLAQVYDLSPFLFTKKIQIQSQVIPHSHPVLTLNTRHADEPKKILSLLLHEELHWWAIKKKPAVELAILELKKIYPKAPVTRGSGPDSTHLHLIVCYLELKALGHYLGAKEARLVVTDIMKRDKIYPWVYYQILNKDFAIKKIVEKHQLLPPPL